MEKELPRVFEGAVEIYRNLTRTRNSNKHIKPSREERRMLKEKLKGEYKLYDHAVKKLNKKYQAMYK